VTFHGQTIDLAQPDPSTITLRDISHNLSNLVRFNGSTKYRYSVAQHSIYVSKLVAPEHALQALMHDAPEAYLGDVVSPLKGMLPAYKEIEINMWHAICLKFKLDPAVTKEVHMADAQAYLQERCTLIPTIITDDPDVENFKGMIIPHIPIKGEEDPVVVARDFRNRFHQLKHRSVM